MNAVIEQRDAALSQVSLYKYIISSKFFFFFSFQFLGGFGVFCFTFGEENYFIYFSLLKISEESPCSKCLITDQLFFHGGSAH